MISRHDFEADASGMNILSYLFKSSLGRKYIMAASGLALFAFVIGHLLGNLQIFLAPEVINRYAQFLKDNIELVWGARIGLLGCIALHIWTAISLSADNKAARPVAYADATPPAASMASRTMLMSGLIVFFFILYHLLHFTVQVEWVNGVEKTFHSLKTADGHHDVYSMVVIGFRQPLVALCYVIAVGLLCLHLSHGVGASFQSLGLKNKAWGPVIDTASKVVSFLIFVGYASIPLAVLTGIVGDSVAR